jgi:hypothetical protein
MTLRQHWKGESQTLRVDYNVTDGGKSWIISEFLKPGNFGFHKFTQSVGAIGNSVDNVVAEAALLTPPSRLMVKKRKGSKFFEIVSRYRSDSKNQLALEAA